MITTTREPSSEPRIKVAYMLHRFPYLTETFIMHEMYALRACNVDVHIFSLLSPKHDIVHAEAKELQRFTTYSRFVSLPIVAALLHFLGRHPVRLLRSLVNTIRQTIHEPGTMARALVLFPKSVLYARQIQALGVQHVHAHFVWLEGLAAGVVTDLTGIEFSIHPHAFDLFSRHQKDVRAELENAAKVVTISKYHQDYIARLCPGIRAADIAIVHCGVDVDKFRPLPGGKRNGPFRILSVGRLLEKKGYPYLIQACALLKQRGVPFCCEIVGGGKKHATELQQLIARHGLQNDVTLAGPLGQDDIVKRYHNSDLFVLACIPAASGDQDGIPVVLMEAMACGLPVVSTALSGIPELVHDGHNGRLVPPRDAEALASAVEELIACETTRAAFAARARETVVAEFEIKKNAARMAAIFRAVIGTHDPHQRPSTRRPVSELEMAGATDSRSFP
jgi:glycosyltransferase involved in cell wall biosynthesis